MPHVIIMLHLSKRLGGLGEVVDDQGHEHCANQMLADAEVNNVHHVQRQMLEGEPCNNKQRADKIQAMVALGVEKKRLTPQVLGDGQVDEYPTPAHLQVNDILLSA